MEHKLIMSFLAGISFFNDFSLQDKAELIQSKDMFIKFWPDQLIIKEGNIDDGLFIILKGQVAVTKQSKPNATLAQLGPGSLFGEINLISKKARTTNVTALNEVVVMRITQEMVDRLDPNLQKKFQSKLINLLVQRLEEMNQKLASAMKSNI